MAPNLSTCGLFYGDYNSLNHRCGTARPDKASEGTGRKEGSLITEHVRSNGTKTDICHVIR